MVQSNLFAFMESEFLALQDTPRSHSGHLRHRILVADDEKIVRRLHAEALMEQGYRVDTAEDGNVAWQAISTTHYDLLITDNRMPNVSGLELLEKVRAARMNLPVIMATGTLPAEEFVREPWLAPDAMLLKPYTINAFLEKVKEVLSICRKPAAAIPER
jgi:DNA-binding response OmpR family regulator